ncbi:MAG: tRNA pseudouridine(55) synthase TruB [Ruminococcus sp.]|jgi:tRNA pseudouridine55 synthase|nr:tRNA pseudouridine(55) synthase TruB [Ruminococcus sp.]
MNGVLLIDKPQEYTSFDVVAVIRRLAGQKKIGHTGTLDPNATGVLVVLLGNATKAQDLILNHDKTYVADFKLGITTDTLDIWGKVTNEKKSSLLREEILNILPEFTGEISQMPPMFSAVQKNGQRLYDLARQGVEVERESRNVTVYSLELLGFDEETQSGKLKVACSKGTYVRTLIDDIGRKLGVGAVMTGLRRTSACGFDISDCITLDMARKLAENSKLEERLLSVESLFESLGYVSVSDAQSRRFSNGGVLDIDRTYLKKIDLKNGDILRVKDRENNFLGLGVVDLEKRLLKIYKLF